MSFSDDEMSMDTSTDDGDWDSSFVSNTDATICNTADLCSAWGLSMISDPNIPADSSSETSICDDLIVLGGASSRPFTNNDKQSHEQSEIRIFNVVFRQFSSDNNNKEKEKGSESKDDLDMGRQSCSDNLVELRKGSWTVEEDMKLINYLHRYGIGNWRAVPKYAGLLRDGNSCRSRWKNYLRPGLKRGRFSEDEEKTIITLHSLLGNRWSAIATHLPGRTDNEIRHFWYTYLKKKLEKMGINPVTHRPFNTTGTQ